MYLCGNLETARILVFGNVQGVGFRAYVEQIARNMQIKGFARNLDDGSVEIYAKAPKMKIRAFVGKISIKGAPSDPFSLNVTKTDVAFEHDKNFIKPDRTLERFETDYGKESDIQKEMVKKAATATFLMHSLNSKSDSLISKTDSFRKETSHNFKRLESTLGSKTDSFRKETSSNFSKLDNKYGSISKAMNNISGNITKNNKLLSKIAGVLSKA